jgi:TolA-binding protein
MLSTVKPKTADDPHDIVVVAPEAVQVVPAEEELSKLLRAAARHHSDQPARPALELPTGATIPPIDRTFRPAALSDVKVSDIQGNHIQPAQGKRSTGRRIMRAFTALLLAACVGGAAMAWQSFGYAGKKVIAKWLPQFAMTTSFSLEKLGFGTQSTPPDVQTEASSNPTSPEASPPVTHASETVAAAAVSSGDTVQALQSMARDLANMGQQMEQLKTSIEQLKTVQQQMSRDFAKAPDQGRTTEQNKASDQSPRPNRTATSTTQLPSVAPPATPRPAVPRVRKPNPPSQPLAIAAPALTPSATTSLSQTATPYVSRPAEPLPQAAITDPAIDSDSWSAPRPPMPVR